MKNTVFVFLLTVICVSCIIPGCVQSNQEQEKYVAPNETAHLEKLEQIIKQQRETTIKIRAYIKKRTGAVPSRIRSLATDLDKEIERMFGVRSVKIDKSGQMISWTWPEGGTAELIIEKR